MHDLSKEVPLVEYILVIYGFVDMFPTDLPSLPLDHDIDFPIHLELDIFDIFP